MAKSAFERLLDGVAWTSVPCPEAPTDGLPFVTHEGVLRLGTFELTVLQLSTGQRIIPADEMERFFGALGDGPGAEQNGGR